MASKTDAEKLEDVRSFITCAQMILNLGLIVWFAFAAYYGDWWFCALLAYIELMQINSKVKR